MNITNIDDEGQGSGYIANGFGDGYGFPFGGGGNGVGWYNYIGEEYGCGSTAVGYGRRDGDGGGFEYAFGCGDTEWYGIANGNGGRDVTV